MPPSGFASDGVYLRRSYPERVGRSATLVFPVAGISSLNKPCFSKEAFPEVPEGKRRKASRSPEEIYCGPENRAPCLAGEVR